jgi:hypothetical protein
VGEPETAVKESDAEPYFGVVVLNLAVLKKLTVAA